MSARDNTAKAIFDSEWAGSKPWYIIFAWTGLASPPGKQYGAPTIDRALNLAHNCSEANAAYEWVVYSRNKEGKAKFETTYFDGVTREDRIQKQIQQAKLAGIDSVRNPPTKESLSYEQSRTAGW